MRVYCVRHRRTRNFLPYEWTSPSWWEGERGKGPRTFPTDLHAKAFVKQWLLGPVFYKDDGNIVRDSRGRTKDMLEIVPMDLMEAKP